MIVAFDNTFLSLALNENTIPTPNPSTGIPASHCAHRVEGVVDDIARAKGTVLIPTPCLAELLTAVPDIQRAVFDHRRVNRIQYCSI
ncbi:MAG: hypothetical protein ACJAZW_001282 [Maritalea sp.]